MSPRRKVTHSTNAQSARFIEAAKKTGADQSGKAFEKAINKIVRAPIRKKSTP